MSGFPGGITKDRNGLGRLDCTAARRARCLQTVQRALQPSQRLFIGLVALGVGWVTYNFITVVLVEISAAEGVPVALAYFVWGLWLLFNIVYNYTMAVLRSPGCTSDFDPELLKASMTYDWKWCMRCNAPKPPQCHHCSMCKRCVLRMDHHCLWLASCVGHGNYRHFFLFLLYLCIGSGYAASVTAHRFSARVSTQLGARLHEGTLMQCILSAGVCAVLVPLLTWHVAVICSGMGTLELMDRWCGVPGGKRQQQEELQEQGQGSNGRLLLREPGQHARLQHKLRPLENWQRVFNVHGRLWWLLWLLPSSRPPYGNGFEVAAPAVDQLHNSV